MILEVECRRRVTNPYSGWQGEFEQLLEDIGASEQYELEARDHYFEYSKNGWLRVRDHTYDGKRGVVSQIKEMLDELYSTDDVGIRVAREIDKSQIDSEFLSEELEKLEEERSKLCEVYGTRLSYKIGEIEVSLDHIYGKGLRDHEIGYFIEVGIDRDVSYSEDEILLRESKDMARNIRSFIQENLLQYFEKINAEIEPRIYHEIVLDMEKENSS